MSSLVIWIIHKKVTDLHAIRHPRSGISLISNNSHTSVSLPLGSPTPIHYKSSRSHVRASHFILFFKVKAVCQRLEKCCRRWRVEFYFWKLQIIKKINCRKLM
ncbi:hypothetical protein EUGRSUZ_A01220 [Eucalyptus grandis]|uniref:Uncharacterized protein n=2 Tax=Eucalyptus grandis TaxID=71139 RepID=A0ACC3M2T9_EUCGR|nr:hypothetical protein EUGRSUZ_A01220 [Eucalyptus grandis]